MKLFPSTAMRCGAFTLYPIEPSNSRDVHMMFARYEDLETFAELSRSYVPRFAEDGSRTRWGFYTRLYGELAGLSLLGLSEDVEGQGYTGADTLSHMRGKGVAPGSKPALFYFGFEILRLKKIITGCRLSNTASQRSIEKTPGFEFQGIVKDRKNDQGEFEEERRYAIKRKDWARLYADVKVDLVR